MKRFVKAVFGLAAAVAMMFQMESIVSAETTSSIEVNGHIVTPDELVVQYHIHYDANGGTGSYEVSDVAAGSTYVVCSLLETGITHPGYTFIGWNTASDGSQIPYNPGDTIKLENDIILYARWERETQQTDGNTENAGNAANTSSGSKTDAVQTGDTNNIIMWINLLCVALIGIIFLLWFVYYKNSAKCRNSKEHGTSGE